MKKIESRNEAHSLQQAFGISAADTYLSAPRDGVLNPLRGNKKNKPLFSTAIIVAACGFVLALIYISFFINQSQNESLKFLQNTATQRQTEAEQQQIAGFLKAENVGIRLEENEAQFPQQAFGISAQNMFLSAQKDKAVVSKSEAKVVEANSLSFKANELASNVNYVQILGGIMALMVFAFVVFILLLFRKMREMSCNNDELKRLAYTDLLTGARNYGKFLQDAKEHLQKTPKRNFSVWTMDVKKFGRVNDVFENKTGDLLLKWIAKMFDDEELIFGRMAADQFVGIREFETQQDLITWFWTLVDKFNERQVLPNNQIHIDVSMGFYCIADFADVPELIDMVSRAIEAKKEAKEAVGSNLMFFTHEMSEKNRREAELEASGKNAINNNEITFFLQPKVNVQKGGIIDGAEVLARWNHPEHGWISPAEFIPVFESNGFVIELDRYIFEKACKWFVNYLKIPNAPKIRLSINVSRQGLMCEDFIEYYYAIKEWYGIADGLLELEFTESVILEDYETFNSVVEEMQKFGFICSIDDFGSGYSSLNVLKNLPIDVLKLDAGFFRDSIEKEKEQVVISNFINMAKDLNIRTVAEGVETSQQVEFLQKSGCTMVQGYFFSKPLTQEDFEEKHLKCSGVYELPTASEKVS